MLSVCLYLCVCVCTHTHAFAPIQMHFPNCQFEGQGYCCYGGQCACLVCVCVRCVGRGRNVEVGSGRHTSNCVMGVGGNNHYCGCKGEGNQHKLNYRLSD